MITGDRVALRAAEPGDAETLYRWFQQDWFRTAVGQRYPQSRSAWEQWIAAHQNISYGNVSFMVCLTDGGTPIGMGSLNRQSPEDRSAEFGVAIGEARYLRGALGIEAAELLGRFGFEVMGLHRMYAWILDRNRAAIAACTAVGAVREGVARQARLVDGHHSDLMLYGVLAEEFAVAADRACRRRPLLKRNTEVS
ncbi:GNAT family N-acetyltransferase [Nocardia sp. NPDC059180]|uniref:GNAT family N-acetyltransferase n=1 Tax=Nocardia sp. NPDC059180 TaxID=3346761 RepID=UPI0036A61747